MSITFAYPMVLWAATAVAAPIIIHLTLRTRPRRIVFPAMRFVRKTHQATVSRLKLKHLILLAMRMLAMLLIALLLAKPTFVGGRVELGSAEPAAVVVAIDNSGSMGYRFGGRTHLAAGKEIAQRFVDQLPGGSRVAVISGSASSAKTGFQIDRRLIARLINEAPQEASSLQVGPLAKQALSLLAQSDLSRKLVLLVNDRTSQSWRDVRPGDLSAARTRFALADCWEGDNVNFALGDVRLGQEISPAGVAVPVNSSVRCGRTGGQVLVQMKLAPTTVEQQKGLTLAGPDGQEGVEFHLTPGQSGVVEGVLRMDLDDPLAVDNVRYFTLSVQPLRTMLIARDATTVGRSEPTSFVMGNAVSPPGLASGQAVQRKIISVANLGQEKLGEAPIVMLANVSSLPGSQWSRLRDYVLAGGRLWVVPGELTSVADYNSPPAQALLPVRLAEAQQLQSPLGFQAGRLDSPYLAPFVGQENPPLSAVQILRRMKVAARSDARTELAFADGEPAIVTRDLGAGKVLWWSFSPVPDWSNLAPLEQMPILASRSAVVLMGSAQQTMNYKLGQVVSLPVPPDLVGSAASVHPPEGPDRPVSIDTRTGLITLTPDQVGHWSVYLAAGGAGRTMYFAVNTPAEESDLSLLTPQQIQQLFPPGDLTIARSADRLHAASGQRLSEYGLLLPIGLLVAGLLIGESFLSNRFYRRPGKQDQGQTGPSGEGPGTKER